MTVPVQRGAGQEDSTVLGMVLDGVREVKETVRAMQSDINSRLDSFDQRYVPRQEIDARFTESQRDRQTIHALITEHKAKHDTDITKVGTAVQQLEEKLTSGRRWAIGACLMALGVLVALLSLILTNLPH